MSEKIPLLVIAGPTASGKTRLAVELAKLYNGEVVSADSMQVYKELSVITARPTEEEMCGIPHHLMGFLPLEKSFSVAEYTELARKIIADIYSRGKLPILCGGTGLYISSLINNVTFDDSGADPKLRTELEEYAQKYGNHALWERLEAVDPKAAAVIHENNLIRVIRALEITEKTGLPFSEQKKINISNEPIYEACTIVITLEDRAELYDRINKRVDIMLENGMLDEARRVFTSSAPDTAKQAIGYKELIPYLEGRAELEECIDRIKQETRHYAKRQLTWFRRMEQAETIFVQTGEKYKIFFENVQNTIAKSKIMCYNIM
ncbi:MAG: tRNA (adenosine(37)-N6)-dimethylallyltransferase MiaA [Ruminococcus sp.]|nr:tRNA (adenosine(37)-N6)-dimethylallyltransferase MiaA [Ruminococcus sp.]